MQARARAHTYIFVENPKERDHLEELEVEAKTDLNKTGNVRIT